MYFDPAGKKIKGPGGGKEIKGRATIYTPGITLTISASQRVTSILLSSLVHTNQVVDANFLQFLPQDQYDNIAKHTEKGIDFCEYYSRFIKERSDCELAYAKSLR